MNDTIKLYTSIEQTILKADTSISDIQRICVEAMENNFPAVCVPPYYVSEAVDLVSESNVEVATVIGFPFGYNSILSKFEDAEEAVRNGADHLDIVINIAAIKNNDWETIETEVETFTKLVHNENKIIKIIAETGLLNEIEIDLLCKIGNDHQIDYLKTSTGINAPGATVEIVEFIRKLLLPSINIKASGGIKTREAALALLKAGATRIGTSNGLGLLK